MEVRIPKLGVAMEEGTIVSWLAVDGAVVQEGIPLYVLETDKVENEVPCPASGVLRIVADAGSTLSVGAKIAEIT
jgi:pyruvate/2-oxoglutarate dehydrogenase complex dihydrolipoamide acyltransferase (E2) component